MIYSSFHRNVLVEFTQTCRQDGRLKGHPEIAFAERFRGVRPTDNVDVVHPHVEQSKL